MADKSRVPRWTAEMDQKLLHALIFHKLTQCPTNDDAQKVANYVFPGGNVSGKVIATRFQKIRARKDFSISAVSAPSAPAGPLAPAGSSPATAAAAESFQTPAKRKAASENMNNTKAPAKRVKREAMPPDEAASLGAGDSDPFSLSSPTLTRRASSRFSPKADYSLLNDPYASLVPDQLADNAFFGSGGDEYDSDDYLTSIGATFRGKNTE